MVGGFDGVCMNRSSGVSTGLQSQVACGETFGEHREGIVVGHLLKGFLGVDLPVRVRDVRNEERGRQDLSWGRTGHSFRDRGEWRGRTFLNSLLGLL